ncbi:shikimate dehydrogenase [Solimonas marina]|uniref:Shikimate dehydrogenase (NADP(+)) n=1 Tax=Solimonas marina TaxID=2714601 RepID=A0A969W6D2_9GAMM|nr:shikimate dehydrogenase [Solimonas marina]NKF21237.1 shikimate dehydrogenase [Solimonas marina]
MTDRYAVIGQPISHSQSPAIHAAFAQATSQDLRYDAIDVAPEALTETLKQLHADGLRGLNVTMPHKAAVVEQCELISERAALAGAVNTLSRTDAGWHGDNTDGEGLMRDLTRLGYTVEGRRVLVLGAGGAVRGILGPLLAAKPSQLVVSNRNPWKPEALAEQFKAVGSITPRTHLALKGDRYDLIINAMSVGHSGSMPRLPDGLVADGGACYDLSYGAAHAPFRTWTETQGATRIADGLGMLVEQAAASFDIWRGVRPQTDAVLKALRAG